MGWLEESEGEQEGGVGFYPKGTGESCGDGGVSGPSPHFTLSSSNSSFGVCIFVLVDKNL